MPLHTFGTPREKPVYQSNIKKTKFLDLKGTATVRILTTEATEITSHFVNASKATVRCLDEECPICANNKVLIMQYPDNFRDEAKYSPKRIVYLVNVLDKTPVRLCECGVENRVSQNPGPQACKCGKILTEDAKPSNTIKVLSRGVTLFDQLDAINNAILDDKGERVGLTRFDITFVVSGEGKTKVITPIAGQVSEPVEFNEEDLYDLENVTIKLTPTEMVDLQGGVSLKDIFAARRATEKAAAIGDTILPEEVLKSVQSDVDELFK